MTIVTESVSVKPKMASATSLSKFVHHNNLSTSLSATTSSTDLSSNTTKPIVQNNQIDNVNLSISSTTNICDGSSALFFSISTSTLVPEENMKINNNNCNANNVLAIAETSDSALIQAVKMNVSDKKQPLPSPPIQTVENIPNGSNCVVDSNSCRVLFVDDDDKAEQVIEQKIECKQDKDSQFSTKIMIDENSNNSVRSSSSSNESSPKKKRRRGEDQRLIEDLATYLNGSSVSNVQKILKMDYLDGNNSDTSSATSNINQNENDDTKTTKSLTTKTNDDCPALHLRPRRNIRPPSFSGYYSSGSSSPIYPSPVKNRPNRHKTTSILLNGTWKVLSKYLESHEEQSTSKVSANDVKIEQDSEHNESSSNAPLVRASLDLVEKKEMIKSITISMDRCVLQDVDAAVFAQLISPNRIEIDKSYRFNYVALKIIDYKQICFIELFDVEKNIDFKCPLLELTAVDINDRFNIDYAKGVFDDPTISCASPSLITVYLLGSYALKSKNLARKDSIINIVKFRTCPNKTNYIRTINKKRKLLMETQPTEQEYPFSIIVDSQHDLDVNFKVKTEKHLKNDGQIENSDGNDDGEVIDPDNPFIDLYKDSQIKNNIDNNDGNRVITWSPFISYSDKWQPPKDPRVLNRPLYIFRQCIPKFESSSRTITNPTSINE